MAYMQLEDRDLANLLEGVPLFQRCHPSDLRVVARHCEVRTVPAGTTLIRRGDSGDEMFLVLAGEVVRGGPDGNAKVHGVGGYFGELAILDPAPRSLDVVTRTETTVAVLSRASLNLVLDAVPGVASELLASLAVRVRAADVRAAGA